jgi:ribosomal protein L40E
MQNIRVDEDGNQRCWNCGGKNFTLKRTFRSKVLFGVGALLTHKKLKCQLCGEYNQTGAAEPFTGAHNQRLATMYGTEPPPAPTQESEPETESVQQPIAPTKPTTPRRRRAKAAAVSLKTCPSCGAQVPVTHTKCRQCSADLGTTEK